MDREEILLKEYETCQSHNNALGNQSWISISIIITVNLLLLGQVISNVVLKSSPDIGYPNFIVIILGIGIIYILLLFKQWNNRVTFHTRLNHDRMREIEMEIMEKEGDWVIQKNWRVRSLDIDYDPKERNIKTIPETFKAILEDLKKRYPKSKKNADKSKFEWEHVPSVLKHSAFRFDNIFCVLIALWGIVIVLEALTYCPAVYGWLFN